MAMEIFSNPFVIWGGIIFAAAILLTLIIFYIRNKFGFKPTPEPSQNNLEDPAAILTQINNLQNSMRTAKSLDQAIQDMFKLKTNLSSMSINSIYSAIQTVQSEINIISKIPSSSNALSTNSKNNLTQIVTSLTEQVSGDLLTSLQKLSTDLPNALPNVILVDLNKLKTDLINAYSNENTLAEKIDNILNQIANEITLSSENKKEITNILNQVSTVNSANSAIAKNISSIKSNLNSTSINISELVTNLNQLNSTIDTFIKNNTQQITNINSQISSLMSNLNNEYAGLTNNNKSSVSSILTIVQNLTTTSNSVQTLSVVIQKQIETESDTTIEALIVTLNLLQNKVTQISTSQTNDYNSLNSSITSFVSSISGVNTLTSQNQDTINSILNLAGSMNSSNATIGNNLINIQNNLTGNTVATTSTILINLSSLQASISNSTSANISSFSDIISSLNKINSSIFSGIILNTATTGQMSSALTSIQNIVIKALNRNSFLTAVAQLKQNIPSLVFNKFGILQSMDSTNTIGLTKQFDEYTKGKNIGAIGRVYVDTTKTPNTYYHIDGAGSIYNVILGTPYNYNNIADGKTHSIIIQSNTVVYDSSDPNGIVYNKINLDDSTLSTAVYKITSIGLFSTPWPNYPTILMNTSTVIAETTKYLSVSINSSDNTLSYYISSDGASFTQINPLTGATIAGPSIFISGGIVYSTPYLINGLSTGVFMNTARATASTKFGYKNSTTFNIYICSYKEDDGLTPVAFDLVNSAGAVTTARCLWMIGNLIFETASTKLGHIALTTSADNSRKYGNYMTTTSSGSTQYLYVPNTSNDVFFSGTPMPLGISTDGIKFMPTTGSKAIGNVDNTKYCYIANSKLYLTPEPINNSIFMTTSTVTAGTTLYGGYIGSQFYISTDGIAFLPFDIQANLPTSTANVYIVGNNIYSTAYSNILNVYMNGSSLSNSAGLLYYSPVKNAYFYAAITNGTPGSWLTATAASLSGSAFASTNSPNSVCVGNYGFIENNNPATEPKYTGLSGPNGALTVYYNGNSDTTKDLFGLWLNNTDYYVSTDGIAFYKLTSFPSTATTDLNANITITAVYIMNGILFYPNPSGDYQNYNRSKYLMIKNNQYYISTDGIEFNPYDPLTNVTNLEIDIFNIPGYGSIGTPVGNTAPGVYMNGSSIATSTVFVYKSLSGAYYLSTDSTNNGGAFYQITSINTIGFTLSPTSQVNIFYTDLLNGGFFEYVSTNPNHTTAMSIKMNTPTIQSGVTKYGSMTLNAANNFSGYMYSQDGIMFIRVISAWLGGNSLIYDTNNTCPANYIIASMSFNDRWNPSLVAGSGGKYPWNNPSGDKNVIMNTNIITTTTKYLYIEGGNYSISSDGIAFNPVNISTGAIDTGTTVFYVSGIGSMQYLVSSDSTCNASGVYMNQTTFSESTAFLYKSIQGATTGKYYLSTDGDDTRSGGSFFLITIPAIGKTSLSTTVQTDILYTNLKNGGFFQYPSTNSNHSSGMNIFMNTSTVNTQTIYAYKNNAIVYSSSDGNFFVQINPDGTYGTNTFLIANGKIINYLTNKPGVISTVPTNNVITVYYYKYNNSLYTSTDFVKFTNPAGDVIYYLESEDVVPASAVSTVNGVLWAKIGLMSVQVLNPSIFTLSYESTNYGLYWSDSSVLLTNGIYSNPGNTKYLYLHQKNWYVSTDKITFNKIILDANQNPTGVDTSAAGTIYTFNNQVQTSAPATKTNAGKTYWQFGGILYVDPTNLGDTFVYYNNTVYAQQTPANSYNGREHYWIAVRYIPTYISSGTIFGSNNTILFNPVLGAFSLFSNRTNATLINPERNNPTGNVADNVFANAARTFYSSKSGYYIMIYRFRDALEGMSIVPNIIYNQAFSLNIQNGTLGKARNIFDKYPLTHTILATGSEYDEIYRFEYNHTPTCQQLICKATGQGTLQYVGWCQRTQHFDASVPLNSSGGPLGGYFAFETTTYLGSSLIWDTPLVWDSSANQYTVVRDWGGGISGYVRSVPSGVIIAVNCKKLNMCGYINPACLEPYTFAKFYFPTHESYATYNSELRSYGVTSTNYQALAFVGALDATGGAKVAIPSIRASFSMSKAYQLVRPDFISSTTSDTSWNGSIGQIANGINAPYNYWIANSYEGWNFPY